MLDQAWGGPIGLHALQGDSARLAKANSGAPLVLVAYGRDDALKLKQSGIVGHFVVIERK